MTDAIWQVLTIIAVAIPLLLISFVLALQIDARTSNRPSMPPTPTDEAWNYGYTLGCLSVALLAAILAVIVWAILHVKVA